MAITIEQLKDNVPWAPGYHVTEDGKVYTRKAKNKLLEVWKEKSISKHPNGYFKTTIASKKFSIHRLVAMVYLPRIPNKDYVLHKDNNKENNHKDNLRWGTQQENIDQMISEGRQQKYTNRARVTGEKNANSKISDATRAEILKLHKQGFRRRSIMIKLKVTKGQHRRITKGIKYGD